MIWRAEFDLLPEQEPAGDGWARWKTQRAGEWWVCERKNADEISCRLPLVVSASDVVLWLGPLRVRARQSGDEKLTAVLDMVVRALDAADSGFKRFEERLASMSEDPR